MSASATTSTAASLELLNAAGTVVSRVSIEGSVVTIGRAESNQLVLNDPIASKTHAEVSREGGEFLLKDLASRNGTFRNGRRVLDSVQLFDGDVIRMGASRVRFRAPGGPQRPAQTEAGGRTLEFSSPLRSVDGAAGGLEQLREATSRIAAAADPVTLVEEVLADVFAATGAEAAEIVLLEANDPDHGTKPLLRVASDSRVDPHKAKTGPSKYGVSVVTDPYAAPLPLAKALAKKVVREMRAVEGNEVPAERFAGGAEIPVRLAMPVLAGGWLFGHAYVERSAGRGPFNPTEALRMGIICDALGTYLRGAYELD
jgi:predicted component of type VI protein secretion system